MSLESCDERCHRTTVPESFTRYGDSKLASDIDGKLKLRFCRRLYVAVKRLTQDISHKRHESFGEWRSSWRLGALQLDRYGLEKIAIQVEMNGHVVIIVDQAYRHTSPRGSMSRRSTSGWYSGRDFAHVRKSWVPRENHTSNIEQLGTLTWIARQDVHGSAQTVLDSLQRNCGRSRGALSVGRPHHKT
jgi:hypothetical protein